jgi:hypothetical protein
MVRSILLLAAVGLASASTADLHKHKLLAGNVFSLASTTAAAPVQHKQTSINVAKVGGVSRRSLGLNARQSEDECATGEVVCDDTCMTIGRVCCNDGSGSCSEGLYCVAGTPYCSADPNATADDFDDDFGDDDDDLDSEDCGLDFVDCDGFCMPIGSTCCNDGSGWCFGDSICNADDTCGSAVGGDSGDNDDDDSSEVCGSDEQECDGYCIGAEYVCCNDGSGYCSEGLYCISGTDQCSLTPQGDDDEDDDDSSSLPTLPSLTFPTRTSTSSSSTSTSETETTTTTTTTTTTSESPAPTGTEEQSGNEEEEGDNDGNGSAAAALVPGFLVGALAMALPLLL